MEWAEHGIQLAHVSCERTTKNVTQRRRKKTHMEMNFASAFIKRCTHFHRDNCFEYTLTLMEIRNMFDFFSIQYTQLIHLS